MESAQATAAGQWLGKLILCGKCPERHENSGKCIGELKLFFYPWCNQYRLACDHCGTGISMLEFNLDPMPHRIVFDIREYVEIVECTPETAIWSIRKRFRDIEYRTSRVQQALFSE